MSCSLQKPGELRSPIHQQTQSAEADARARPRHNYIGPAYSPENITSKRKRSIPIRERIRRIRDSITIYFTNPLGIN